MYEPRHTSLVVRRIRASASPPDGAGPSSRRALAAERASVPERNVARMLEMLVQAQASPATAQQARERRLSAPWPNNETLTVRLDHAAHPSTERDALWQPTLSAPPRRQPAAPRARSCAPSRLAASPQSVTTSGNGGFLLHAQAPRRKASDRANGTGRDDRHPGRRTPCRHR